MAWWKKLSGTSDQSEWRIVISWLPIAGSDLMKEHLREIRGLRQRLEDSIQTNDRLRQQLEERLARTAADKGNTHSHIRTHTFPSK